MRKTKNILFDAGFESGNLDTVQRIGEYEYDLFIRADPATQTRMWFYFKCYEVPLETPVLFNIIGMTKADTTFSSKQTILVRSTSRPKW